MAIKLKNSRNIGRVIIVLVMALCSVGMMLTYWQTRDELNKYVPARSDTESVIASLSDNLSAGNYIMDKDVYGGVDVLDMQEEYYAFGLLRKYMDCAVFDQNGELLTSGVDSKRAERLKDEESDYYAFRVEYTFAAGENFPEFRFPVQSLPRLRSMTWRTVSWKAQAPTILWKKKEYRIKPLFME